MMNELLTQTIDLISGNPADKRVEIRNYFKKTYAIDEALFKLLKHDATYYKRADPLRHPLIFYLGHTAVFFMNKLILAGLVKERVNPHFESIFAIGVDEMSWDDLNENHYDWPDVSAVWEYRERVKEVVLKVIDHTPLEMPISWENPFWIIMMGIEHERIHLETSSVLIRQLPIEEINTGAFGTICEDTGEAPENSFVSVEGGTVTLGKPKNHAYYGWDNEYGNYTEEVAPFKAGEMLISNGEFKQFIDAGGYENRNYWTGEGWSWCTYKEAQYPLFWEKDPQGFKLRLVDRIVEMPWSWPVEVNYLEAKAYANWLSEQDGKSYRLPSEAEWYKMAQENGLKDKPVLAENVNINLQQFASPMPVNKNKTGAFYDLAGNVWQWTENPITGFPGFKVHPLYDDFTTPTFDGKHNIIKGGSWISTGNEATYFARYAFRRHFYQHAGFRVVESDVPLVIREDSYEYDEAVAQSCEMNYGKSRLGIENFSVQLAKISKELIQGKYGVKALDLNCDTGRTVFELAPYVSEITGLDFSARFIKMAVDMQTKGFVRYVTKDENELVFYHDAQLKELGLENADHIQFMQADANNIKPIYTGYDLVIAPNILEELYNPIQFLKSIHERINDRGFLVLGSTYDWQRNDLNTEMWPGGYKQDGEPITSLDGISKILNTYFERVEAPIDINYTIPYSSRKVEVRTSEITIWRKN